MHPRTDLLQPALLALATLASLAGCGDDTNCSAGSTLVDGRCVADNDGGTTDVTGMDVSGSDVQGTDSLVGPDVPVTGALALTLDTDLERVRFALSFEVGVTIERREALEGPVQIVGTGAAGIEIDELTIAAGETTGTIVVTIAEEHEGERLDVVVRAQAMEAPSVSAEASFQLLVVGRPGTPDRSFGTDGTLDLGRSPVSGAGQLHLMPDGRYLIETSGIWMVNPDGTTDTAFGSDGFHRSLYRSVITEDRIYAINGSDSFLTALNHDGTAALSFGVSGRVDTRDSIPQATPFRTPSAVGVAIRFQRTALLPDGNPDPLFGPDGHIDPTYESFDGIDGLGRIVSHDRNSIARQTSAGTVDGTFGGPGGIVQRLTDAGFETQFTDATIRDDNSMITVESMRFAPSCTTSSLVVRHLGPDGSFDVGFGDGGKLVLTPSECVRRFRVVPVRPDYFLMFFADSSFLLDPFAIAISNDGRVLDDFADGGMLSDASAFGTVDVTGDRWVWAALEDDDRVVLHAFWL